MTTICIKFQIFHTWLCTFVAYSHWWTSHTWILLLHLWGWECDWWVSFFDFPCSPEVVNKVALLIYWELGYSESTHKNCGCSHMNTCDLHLCHIVAAQKLHKLQTSEGTHGMLAVQHRHVYNLQENADSCMGCMTFIYIINLACFNSAFINLNITLFS